MYGRSWAECEMAWTSYDQVARIIKVTVREDKEHPTQKPERLMRACLSLFPDALTILDPFAGSGTTLRAAKDLGRDCTVIEINPKYIEIIKKRERQEVLL